VVEEKTLSLVAEVAMANQQWEATEEQCERLVHELTLLSIRGYEQCITITVAPLLSPLHEGMHFAVAQHPEVATRLSALWVVVSLASQSIFGYFPIDVPEAGVVGEIVVQFRSEQIGAHVSRLLAGRSVTLFSDRWVTKPPWLLIWRCPSGD
jgi:hypothetical protein